MTALASNLLHVLCAVRICVYRAYMGALWNRVNCRGAAGSVLGTLGDGIVVGIGDGSTLGDGAVVGIGDDTTLVYGVVAGIGNAPLGGDVVGALVGRDAASIPCRVLMACICSSPTANGDAGAGLLSASTRSYTAWSSA